VAVDMDIQANHRAGLHSGEPEYHYSKPESHSG